MKMLRAMAVLAALAITGAETARASNVSDSIMVDTSPYHNLHWTTVFTNQIPLRWSWCTNAVNAELTITGMNGSFETNFTDTSTTEWIWPAFSTSFPSVDDVFDLTLAFKDNQDIIVGALTSRLTVVAGAFGQSKVITSLESKPWSVVNDNAVIPYNSEWLETTYSATDSRLVISRIGGFTYTNEMADASGYIGWKIRNSNWGFGTFNLALTFPGSESNGWEATLVRIPEGMIILVR